MAENIVDGGLFKFVFRHGTPEEWDQSVSVLAKGEIGIAIDPADPTRTVARAGDGLRAWADLPDIAGNLEGLLETAKTYAETAAIQAQNAALEHVGEIDVANRSAWASAIAAARKDLSAADQGRLTEAKQYATNADQQVLAQAQQYARDHARDGIIGQGIPTVTHQGNGVYEITGVPVQYIGNGIYEIGV